MGHSTMADGLTPATHRHEPTAAYPAICETFSILGTLSIVHLTPCLMTLAGCPAATLFAGISLVTTERKPIIEPEPIVTPFITATSIAIQT